VNGILYAVNCILTSFGFWLFRRGIYYSRKYDVSASGVRYFEKFSDPFSSHSLVWRRLQKEDVRGKTILELSVGDASLTKRMGEAGAIVDGVEIDPLYANRARPYCRKVYEGDLNTMASIGITGEYDVIVAADVLEHLLEPELVLSQLKARLKKGGLLIVSVPNIANIYIRISLLAGRFHYHTKGILDRTHLHFYTLDTARLMLRKTGWIVENGEVTAIPFALVFPFLGRMPMKLLLNLFYAVTRGFKGLLAYQSLWYCRNPNQHQLL
jgi:2-polyprenyl-3-methyl-5-hydroxy-6-metoxy-1,4-benzoquinol methylase